MNDVHNERVGWKGEDRGSEPEDQVTQNLNVLAQRSRG